MKAIRKGMSITAIREDGDRNYKPTGKHGNSWGDGESNFLYHLQQKIQSGEVENWGDLPTDVIKKRMWKDGHLVDVMQLYIRSRKPVKTEGDGKLYLAIWNTNWAISGLNDDWNEDGEVSIDMIYTSISDKEITREMLSQL